MLMVSRIPGGASAYPGRVPLFLGALLMMAGGALLTVGTLGWRRAPAPVIAVRRC